MQNNLIYLGKVLKSKINDDYERYFSNYEKMVDKNHKGKDLIVKSKSNDKYVIFYVEKDDIDEFEKIE